MEEADLAGGDVARRANPAGRKAARREQAGGAPSGWRAVVVVPLARPDPEAAAPGPKIRPPPSPAVGRPRRPLRRTRSHLRLDLLESSAL